MGTYEVGEGEGAETGDEKVGMGRVRNILSCGLQAAGGTRSA